MTRPACPSGDGRSYGCPPAQRPFQPLARALQLLLGDRVEQQPGDQARHALAAPELHEPAVEVPAQLDQDVPAEAVLRPAGPRLRPLRLQARRLPEMKTDPAAA